MLLVSPSRVLAQNRQTTAGPGVSGPDPHPPVQPLHCGLRPETPLHQWGGGGKHGIRLVEQESETRADEEHKIAVSAASHSTPSNFSSPWPVGSVPSETLAGGWSPSRGPHLMDPLHLCCLWTLGAFAQLHLAQVRLEQSPPGGSWSRLRSLGWDPQASGPQKGCTPSLY